MLLNAAKCQSYSFYKFCDIKRKPSGEEITIPPNRTHTRTHTHTHTHTHTPTHNQITVNIFFKKLMVTLGNALKN